MRRSNDFHRTLLVCGVLMFAAFASGCSKNSKVPAVYSTYGEVFVSGKPAAGATITFVPPAESQVKWVPSAVVAADGPYELTTLKPGDGAPIGEYTVVVVWDKTETRDGDVFLIEPDKLEGRYASLSTSQLKATVKKGTNQVPRFDLQ